MSKNVSANMKKLSKKNKIQKKENKNRYMNRENYEKKKYQEKKIRNYQGGNCRMEYIKDNEKQKNQRLKGKNKHETNDIDDDNGERNIKKGNPKGEKKYMNCVNMKELEKVKELKGSMEYPNQDGPTEYKKSEHSDQPEDEEEMRILAAEFSRKTSLRVDGDGFKVTYYSYFELIFTFRKLCSELFSSHLLRSLIF